MFARLVDTKTGEILEIPKPRVLIGRRRGCDIIVNQPMVSAHHCLLYRTEEDGCWHVRDLQSTNGTWVNGVRISESQVFSGDEIHFGKLPGYRLEYGA